MADSKVTGFSALTGANLATGDVFEVVDVSDTSLDASGTNKKMSATELATGMFTVGGLYVPQIVAKTADETVNSGGTGSTLQNDDHLFWSISNSSTEIWFWEAILAVTAANATMDIKFGLSAPSGATARWAAESSSSTPATFGAYATGGAPTAIKIVSDTLALGTAAVTMGLALKGWVYGGGTSGTVNFQWAQNTADAGNLTMLKGSLIRYTKIAA